LTGLDNPYRVGNYSAGGSDNGDEIIETERYVKIDDTHIAKMRVLYTAETEHNIEWRETKFVVEAKTGDVLKFDCRDLGYAPETNGHWNVGLTTDWTDTNKDFVDNGDGTATLTITVSSGIYYASYYPADSKDSQSYLINVIVK
jgi:hypothetical protein